MLRASWRRGAWILVCALVLVGCSGRSAPRDAGAGDDAGDDAGEDAGQPECPAFAGAVNLGSISSTELVELSGLAASRVHDGLLYAHNDSGDAARVFFMSEDGTVLGNVALTGASRRDYEDIAVGPGPDGASWVYVGDHGDNSARNGRGTPRTSVFVHRFPEAVVDPTASAIDTTPETFELTYPDRPHDCESLAVDPDTGDLYLLTKEDTGPSTLFVLRAPLASGVLEMVTTIEIGGPLAPGSRNATAMDISATGTGLLVRTYNRIHLFVRGDGETWTDALGRPSITVPAQTEPQGEAIAWRPDGRGYFTSSEGRMQPLYSFENDARCDAY